MLRKIRLVCSRCEVAGLRGVGHGYVGADPVERLLDGSKPDNRNSTNDTRDVLICIFAIGPVLADVEDARVIGFKDREDDERRQGAEDQYAPQNQPLRQEGRILIVELWVVF